MVLVSAVDRQKDFVPDGDTVAWTTSAESVANATVAAPWGITLKGDQAPSSTVRVMPSRAPGRMQTAVMAGSAGPWVTVTVPDWHAADDPADAVGDVDAASPTDPEAEAHDATAAVSNATAAGSARIDPLRRERFTGIL